jgi:phage/plasmid-associated DNA primase
MDTLGEFISDQCLLDPTCSAKAGELYDAYKTWCAGMGETPQSQRVFGRSLTERGLTRRKSSVYWWDGIALRFTADSLLPNEPEAATEDHSQEPML